MTGVARRWVRDLALGFRLSVGGSRNHRTSWVRLGVGAFGIALAVAVLLGAASAGTVLDARHERAAAQWPDTEPRAGVQPTLLRQLGTDFRGEYIGGGLVQHSDATSPVPPGVPRRLQPGELVISPGLAERLAEPGSELLRGRFDGYRIVGTIAKPGLTDPRELRFVAGTDGLSTAPEESGVQRAYAFGGGAPDEPMPFELVVLVVLGAVVLIVPLLIFIQASSRIAGAERDRRLAAIRLVGSDARQVRRIAAAEALLPAAVGLLVGVGVFYAVRPLAAQVSLFDVAVFPEDIVPAWWAVVLIAVVVPLLAVATAVLALRRTVIEPLGVVRHGAPKRKRSLWWRLLLVALGVGLLLASATVLRDDEFGTLAGVAAGGVLVVLGVASLLPWAVELAIAHARGGPATLQLAARRLQLDAGTSARVVSGIVVVLTGAVAVLVVLTSVQQQVSSHVQFAPRPEQSALAPMVHVVGDRAEVAKVSVDLEQVDGVRGTHPAVEMQLSMADQDKSGAVLVGDCFALRQSATLPHCADGDVFLPASASTENGVVRVHPGDRVPFGERTWQVPRDAKTTPDVRADYLTALATPKAFGPAAGGPNSATTLYLDTGEQRSPQLIERVRNTLGLTSNAWVSDPGTPPDPGTEIAALESVKAWIFAGAVLVLAIASLSVLVLAVEQVRERRRALAAMAAGGIRFGTLARSLLWQNAIPFGIGAVLAVAGGYVLAYLVLLIPQTPMTSDFPALGVLLGSAGVLLLLVTALSLPMLRAAVAVKNLRTE